MAKQGKAISFETRQQIVNAVLIHGLRITDVAATHGVSRKTVWQFVRNYRTDGLAGLAESSRRPRTSPQQKPLELEQQVLALRQQHGWGAAWIGAVVGASSSTVHRILCEHELNNLRPARRKYPRYEMEYPGELVHIDSKDLVPLGSGQAPQYLFAALDGFSREVFVYIHNSKGGAASLDFLSYVLSQVPYPIEAVMTDNALAFSMRRSAHPNREAPFQKLLRQMGIKHLLTKPYTPRTNGKVERFFGTVGRELLRRVHFQDKAHRAEELIQFAEYYNLRRPHSAIRFHAPTPYRINYFQSS